MIYREIFFFHKKILNPNSAHDFHDRRSHFICVIIWSFFLHCKAAFSIVVVRYIQINKRFRHERRKTRYCGTKPCIKFTRVIKELKLHIVVLQNYRCMWAINNARNVRTKILLTTIAASAYRRMEHENINKYI